MSGVRRLAEAHDPGGTAHPEERHVRSRFSLPVFASVASLAFVLAAAVPPPAIGDAPAAAEPRPAQSVIVDAGAVLAAAARDDYGVSRFSTAPAVGVPDPGTAQAIAYELVTARGWSHAEYECLVALWNRESHWNVYAHNPVSGAYGIPQALPGEKMASAGADWRTNPETQIRWGLGYITGRYGTPCGAWAHSEARGWY